jgi:hypothetical protein
LGSQNDIFIYYVDYDLRGIDRNSGCIVIVRPDQHIAAIMPTAAHAKLSEFFARFMIRSLPQT